jgi:hypothetical protein
VVNTGLNTGEILPSVCHTMPLLTLDYRQVFFHVFNIHGPVHRESVLIIVQQDATMYS